MSSILKGTINCKSDVQIPSNSILKIQVLYIVENELKKAKLVSRLESPTAFPITYEIDYSEDTIDQLESSNGTFYFLRATIERNDEVLFRNFSAVDAGFYGDLIGRAGRFRKHLDVFLNHLPDGSAINPKSAHSTSFNRMNKLKA